MIAESLIEPPDFFSTLISSISAVYFSPFLSAIAKRWKFYSMEEGQIDNRYDYYEPLLKGQILDPKKYNDESFFWLKYWSKDGDIARIGNTLIIIINWPSTK